MLFICTCLHLQQALLYQKHKKHCFKRIIQVCARNKETPGNAEAKTTWMSLKTQQSHPTTTHKRYIAFLGAGGNGEDSYSIFTVTVGSSWISHRRELERTCKSPKATLQNDVHTGRARSPQTSPAPACPAPQLSRDSVAAGGLPGPPPHLRAATSPWGCAPGAPPPALGRASPAGAPPWPQPLATRGYLVLWARPRHPHAGAAGLRPAALPSQPRRGSTPPHSAAGAGPPFLLPGAERSGEQLPATALCLCSLPPAACQPPGMPTHAPDRGRRGSPGPELPSPEVKCRPRAHPSTPPRCSVLPPARLQSRAEGQGPLSPSERRTPPLSPAPRSSSDTTSCFFFFSSPLLLMQEFLPSL